MKCWHIVGGLCLLSASWSNVQAVTFNNVVTLGDSLLDDPGGGRSPVAAEHIAQRLGVSVTKFAESGSTSSDLISNGQHTQAAAQFGAGDLAMLWIGGNDFFGAPFQAATGGDAFLDTLIANTTTVLRTLRPVNENGEIEEPSLEVAIFNLPDISKVPGIIETVESIIPRFLRDDAYENLFSATVTYNRHLEALAETHDATVIDVFGLFNELEADPSAFSLLGNDPILNADSGCQFCVFFDDFLLPDVHPSSFAQGFIANEAIATLNGFFDPDGFMPLDPLSIIEIAALAEVYAGDFDGDGTVNADDLSEWQASFGTSGADADGDGDTDGTDFLVWQNQAFGSPQGNVAAVPEPSSMAIVAMLAGFYFSNRPTKQ